MPDRLDLAALLGQQGEARGEAAAGACPSDRDAVDVDVGLRSEPAQCGVAVVECCGTASGAFHRPRPHSRVLCGELDQLVVAGSAVTVVWARTAPVFAATTAAV